MDSLTANSATAHVVKVVGIPRGCVTPCAWYVVFDNHGRAILGAVGDTAAALSIRYVDTIGVPAVWIRHAVAMTPGQLFRFSAQIIGTPIDFPEPGPVRSVPFRKAYLLGV